MKFLMLLLLVVMLAVGCGGDDTENPSAKPATKTKTDNPSNSKWTAEQFNSQSEACAKRGDSQYTIDKWRKYCGCVYSVATKWDYEDFYNYFDYYYSKLETDGTIASCASKAGMK